jgi:hypothetical protein
MIATELGRHLAPDEARELSAQAKQQRGALAEKSVEQGAATSVWAATAPELDEFGGRYLADCQVSNRHAGWALDQEAAARLWTVTEELVGQPFAFGNSSPDPH